MKFVKVFNDLRSAEAFAAEHNSRVVLRYDWDDVFGLIELYEVDFI